VQFSIIVPMFNAERTIERCLRSILDQSGPSFEIIAVDDASADGTVERVRAIADPRLSLVQMPENAGPSACRNAGLAAAAGEFIVFVDADDWLDPDYLERLADAATPAVDYVVARYRLVSSGGSVLDVQSPDLEAPLESFLADRIVSSVWAKAFRAEPIRRHGIRFPDVRYMEDSAFNVSFLLASRGAAFAEGAIYNYSKLDDSATTRPFSDAAVQQIEAGLAATDDVLISAGYERPRLIEARAIRMLLLQGIFRLAADERAGRATGFRREFRRQMIRRFPLSQTAAQPFLHPRDKALIAAFYFAPAITIRLLARCG
jgi:glycosyltransferase involved in cell wall biosynthesis